MAIRVDAAARSAEIDFTGTSRAAAQQLQRADRGVHGGGAVRVPHAGRRRDPAQRRLPEAAEGDHPAGLDASPAYPAAVVAGNVETSPASPTRCTARSACMAGGQGTMNNFTFGNERHQYYETIGGGSGAGDGFDGTDVVQTHMTNSRLTDPEVLELRFPVRLESYEIRARLRRRGPLARRQRRRAPDPLPGADDREHTGQSPPRAAVRHGRRPARRPRPPVDRARGRLRHTDGRQRSLSVAAGDVLVLETPGGGGYGEPAD